jgi:hypothetical protein
VPPDRVQLVLDDLRIAHDARSMCVSLDGFIAGPRGEGGRAPPDAELRRFHKRAGSRLGLAPPRQAPL